MFHTGSTALLRYRQRRPTDETPGRPTGPSARTGTRPGGGVRMDECKGCVVCRKDNKPIVG
jgi:hypothetical protein